MELPLNLLIDLLLDIDNWLLTFFNSTFSHFLFDQFAPVFTDLMKERWAQIGFPLFIFFLLFQHHRKASFGIFLSLLVCMGFSDMTASQVFKKTIQRDRPFIVAKKK